MASVFLSTARVLGNPVLPNHRAYLTNADTICLGQKRMEPTFVVRSRILFEFPSLLKCRTQWSQLLVYSKGFSTFV